MASVLLYPASRSSAVEDIAAAMAVHKLQKPARAELRAALKAYAARLKALGVAQNTIERELAALANAVGARLDQRKRRRIAGAAEQVETRLQARIGKQRATAAPMPAMPRPAPLAPHFCVRFPNKVALHPTWWLHRGRDVERYANFVMRERFGEVAELYLQRSGNAVRFYLKRLFMDDETIDRHARGFEARVRAEVWRRVLLDHDPGTPSHDR